MLQNLNQTLFFQKYVLRYNNALSFYGSKIIFDRPNYFGRVPIILDGTNSFWSGSNHFGQVQIIKISPEKSDLNLTKIIWTSSKRFGPDQNNLYPSKTIWTVQNHFGPIEGQGRCGMSNKLLNWNHITYSTALALEHREKQHAVLFGPDLVLAWVFSVFLAYIYFSSNMLSGS